VIQYLCDTNIISELARKDPDSGVVEWALAVNEVSLSVITVEELHYGLSWRPNARVREWIERFIHEYVAVLPVTESIARRAGTLRGQFQSLGTTRTQADTIIAATAMEHGLTIVTRNVRDFDGCGVALLNPFK
jgi:toxin FitB